MEVGAGCFSAVVLGGKSVCFALLCDDGDCLTLLGIDSSESCFRIFCLNFIYAWLFPLKLLSVGPPGRAVPPQAPRPQQEGEKQQRGGRHCSDKAGLAYL